MEQKFYVCSFPEEPTFKEKFFECLRICWAILLFLCACTCLIGLIIVLVKCVMLY